MSNRANVKPLTHWLIYKGYRVRFTRREATSVAGVITTPNGPLDFRYDAAAQVVHLPDRTVTINEYGWELSSTPPDTKPPL